MNKSFIITEQERSRILGLHQEATSRQYLRENEEEWIDQSQEMEMESDFSKIDLEKLNKYFDFAIVKRTYIQSPQNHYFTGSHHILPSKRRFY